MCAARHLTQCNDKSGRSCTDTAHTTDENPFATLHVPVCAVTLDHPQGDENSVVNGMNRRRIQPTREDKAAGFNNPGWRPAYTCDPSIMTYQEASAAQRPASKRGRAMKQNHEYLSELAAVQRYDGIYGQAAQAYAIKGLFGSAAAAAKRPPSAPSQMLVGTPRERPPSAPPPAPAAAAAFPAATKSTRPSTAARVPSHRVRSRQATLSNSQRFDFVKANARKVAANAAAAPLGSARRQAAAAAAAPDSSTWKLSRFARASPRVFDPPTKD